MCFIWKAIFLRDTQRIHFLASAGTCILSRAEKESESVVEDVRVFIAVPLLNSIVLLYGIIALSVSDRLVIKEMMGLFPDGLKGVVTFFGQCASAHLQSSPLYA